MNDMSKPPAPMSRGDISMYSGCYWERIKKKLAMMKAIEVARNDVREIKKAVSAAKRKLKDIHQ